MNGKQLKNSILQWAIQGKFVPQDPNDEPASVLLEKIRTEKARLIKEGKIKKDKNESFIFRGDDNSYYEKFLATGEVKCIDDEIPFEIPQGWEWCRLKHMCSMQAGKNISASEIYDEKSVLHPYRCVGGNGLRGFTNTFNAEGHFAIIGRQGALCGCLNIESGKFYATEHAVVVNGFGIIPSLFIYYFFTALNLNQYATATAQPGLAVSNIVEVFIPLPPLPEQLRIVSKIEKLLPLVKTYEQAQNGLNELNASLNEQLRKSILQEAIQGKLVPQIAEEGTAEKLLTEIRKEKERLIKEGKLKKSALTDSIIFKGDDNKYYEQIGNKHIDITNSIPFDIPLSWQWIRLGTLFNHCTGKALNASNKEGVMKSYITTSNLYWNHFALDKLKQMPFTENELDKCTVTYGDLLVCEGGDIGRAAVWREDYNICIQNHVHKLRSFIPTCIMFYFYVFYFYKSAGYIGGKGIGIQGLSSRALDQLTIPLPPKSEQERIVEKIEILFDKIKK